tara:strand:- start:47 stop:358 length:312 start_codon:yes stop_codon:yes gene_type:complete
MTNDNIDNNDDIATTEMRDKTIKTMNEFIDLVLSSEKLTQAEKDFMMEHLLNIIKNVCDENVVIIIDDEDTEQFNYLKSKIMYIPKKEDTLIIDDNGDIVINA